MENYEYYYFDWVDVGDQFVCPTCRARAVEPPKFFEDWEATPGDGQSECGDRCRCIFLPHEIVSLDTSFAGGKTILLKLRDRVKEFPVSIEFETTVFKEVDRLVGEYEKISSVYYDTGNWNLPELFYMTQSGNDKVSLLEKLLKWLETGEFPDYVRESIIEKNRWMKGALPNRKMVK